MSTSIGMRASGVASLLRSTLFVAAAASAAYASQSSRGIKRPSGPDQQKTEETPSDLQEESLTFSGVGFSRKKSGFDPAAAILDQTSSAALRSSGMRERGLSQPQLHALGRLRSWSGSFGCIWGGWRVGVAMTQVSCTSHRLPSL